MCNMMTIRNDYSGVTNFGEVVDDDQFARKKLESFFRLKLEENKNLFADGIELQTDMFSMIAPETDDPSSPGGIELEILFSRSVHAETEIPGYELLSIPCIVGGKAFHAYLTTEDSTYGVSVASEREHDADCRELLKKGDMTREEFRRLTDSGTADIPDIAAVDPTDKSFRTASEFLDRLYAHKLKDRLTRLIDEKRVFIINPSAFISGGLAVERPAGWKARGWSIVEQLLADEGVLYPVREKFRTAYERCCTDMGSFDPGRTDPGLGLLSLALEGDGMKFDRAAYTEILDIDDTEILDKPYAQVIDDIKRVYRDIVLREMNGKHDDLAGKVRMFPATRFRYDIVVERLSDHMLPISSISETDGAYTIHINKNFVLFLYELRISGLAGPGGDIYDGPTFIPIPEDGEEAPEPLPQINIGNLYDSLLYSAAIHDICGHFIMKNGTVILKMARNMLNREWRAEHRLVDHIAMSYFWLAMVQGTTRFDCPETAEFIRNNPAVFNKLGELRRDKLLELIGKLSIQMVFDPEADSPEILERVPLPTPAALFRLLKEGAATAGELCGRFNWEYPEQAWYEITQNFNKLINLGLIKGSGTKNRLVDLSRFKKTFRLNKERLFYEMLPMNDDRIDKVQGILDELETSVDIHGFGETKAKMKILELIGADWAKAVIREASSRPTGKTAKDKAAKTVIAIDTGWIPVEQQTFVRGLVREVGKLELPGYIKVIRGDTGTIAREPAEMVEDGLVRRKDIVILAGKDALEKDAFSAVKSGGENNTDSAFLAGVDPKNLTGNSYIRLMEMLTMALRMASGKAGHSDHTGITVMRKNSRTAIFIPKAELLDVLMIEKIYNAQKKALVADYEIGAMENNRQRPHFRIGARGFSRHPPVVGAREAGGIEPKKEKGKELGYNLRSVPITVSNEQCEEIFWLRRNRKPVVYVKNEWKVNDDDTVEDHATGLMWQRAGSSKIEYSDAGKYVKWLNKITFAGYGDWRLPTIPEMISLLEHRRKNGNLYISPLFRRTQILCWSSDQRSSDSAWGVDFGCGDIFWRNHADESFVRAVRP